MTRRFRFETAVAFVIGGVIVAACGGGAEPTVPETPAAVTSSAPVTSSEPAQPTSSATQAEPTTETPASTEETEPPAGPEWFAAVQTGPFATQDALVGRVFSAGGMLWVIGGESSNMLQGTADGENWVTLDLAAAGLPERAGIPVRSGCGDHGVVIEDQGDGFTIVLNEAYPAGVPEYVINRHFLVEINGSEVVDVTSTEGSPLETLLHHTDGKLFRTYCVGGLTTVGDTRYLTGIGDWFVPGATDGGDGFTAALHADGTWDYIVEPGTPFGDGWHYAIEHLTAADGMFVTLGRASASELGSGDAVAWLSPDGHDWEPVYIALTGEDGDLYQLVTGGAGFAALGKARVEAELEKVVVAVSTDGRTWTTTVLTEAGQARGVVVDDDGFRVFGLDGDAPDSVSTMWTSADGVSWEAEEIDLPTALIVDQYLPSVWMPVIPFGDGLLIMIGGVLYANGLDWPPAE